MEEVKSAQESTEEVTLFRFLLSIFVGIFGFTLIYLLLDQRIIPVSGAAGLIIAVVSLSLLNGAVAGVVYYKTRIIKNGLINSGVFTTIWIIAYPVFIRSLLNGHGDVVWEMVQAWSVLIPPYFAGTALLAFFKKFPMKWKIISAAIFSTALIYWILFGLLHIGLSVKLEVTPEKEIYRLGETITTTTTITNYSILPFSTMFSMGDTTPDITVDGVEQPFQPFLATAAFTEVSISPFQSETYEIDLTLIGDEASVDYGGGSSYSHDIVVKPGKNVIITEWFGADSVSINVADQGFDKKEMDCEGFSGEQRKSSCYYKLFLLEDDTSHCDRMVSYFQGDCYVEKAKKENDFSYCEKIKEESNKFTCLLEKAKVTKDFSDCPKMTNWGGLYQVCITEMAKSTNDISICENMEDSWDQLACKKALGIDSKAAPRIVEIPKIEKYTNKYFSYSFVKPSNLKILQEASSDDQPETLMVDNRSEENFTISIQVHKNTEKLSALDWAKKEYGRNLNNSIDENYEIGKVAGQPVVAYSLVEEKGRKLGKSLVFSSGENDNYIVEILALHDVPEYEIYQNIKSIAETFSFEGAVVDVLQ